MNFSVLFLHRRRFHSSHCAMSSVTWNWIFDIVVNDEKFTTKWAHEEVCMRKWTFCANHNNFKEKINERETSHGLASTKLSNCESRHMQILSFLAIATKQRTKNEKKKNKRRKKPNVCTTMCNKKLNSFSVFRFVSVFILSFCIVTMPNPFSKTKQKLAKITCVCGLFGFVA